MYKMTVTPADLAAAAQSSTQAHLQSQVSHVLEQVDAKLREAIAQARSGRDITSVTHAGWGVSDEAMKEACRQLKAQGFAASTSQVDACDDGPNRSSPAYVVLTIRF